MASVIHAVIASVGYADETVFPLMDLLMDEGVYVTLLDNRGTFPTDLLNDRVAYFELPGYNVHQAWNTGMDIALHHEADWCCVFNDDVMLTPGAVQLAVGACQDPSIWIAGFDYERHNEVKLRRAVGTYREHGVGGFAYMIRPGVGLRYDERFNWWGGDDDLVWSCLDRGGRAVVVEGANVQHPPGGNTTGRHFPEVMDGLADDYKLLKNKWGRAWC